MVIHRIIRMNHYGNGMRMWCSSGACGGSDGRYDYSMHLICLVVARHLLLLLLFGGNGGMMVIVYYYYVDALDSITIICIISLCLHLHTISIMALVLVVHY